MIVITGAAGFIGSCLASFLNREGYNDLILVDDFNRPEKNNNYAHLKYTALVDRNIFHNWLSENHTLVQFVFHLGARTDTTEFNKTIFDELNVAYSQQVWNHCVEFGLPLVYASSAATYGLGEFGYDDDETKIEQLKPLNPYGDSKKAFDVWALKQERKPYFWAGLKFFNVYGPNEYHKGRMASVILHAFNQIQEKGSVKLFRSHHPDFKDGEQLRDFIYVMDLINVCYFLMQHRKNSGIYNLGTGKARTFLDLARTTFKAMGVNESIEWVDTPADIRDKYQYFTEANMSKLISIGYHQPFTSLEDGIADYVNTYLKKRSYY
ncbi:MAG: ADP-glyceromanno-heptose 6-epimerase [Bacteroidia bacterium]